MTTESTEQRLDEDFVFILDFFGTYMGNFKSKPIEQEIFQQWLDKLCIEPQRGRQKKRIRNSYLCKLFTCLQASRLTPPFTEKPGNGPLQPMPNIPVSAGAEPPWLKEFLAEQKNQAIFNEMSGDASTATAAAKQNRTYLATKLMKNDNGACAYLAVSTPTKTGDTVKPPQWISMATDDDHHYRSPNQRHQAVKTMPSVALQADDPRTFSLAERKQIGRDIQNELNDLTLPLVSERLEKMVKKSFGSLLTDERRCVSMMTPHKRRVYLLKKVQQSLMVD